MLTSIDFAQFIRVSRRLESIPAMSSIAALPPIAQAEFCVVSRRNDSLGPRARWTLFASLCAVSFGLALGFAAFGAWMVLPYSATEMALLYAAWRWFERHTGDWERVTVTGDRVIMERQSGGVRTRREFNRCWTRLEVDDGAPARASRLALRSEGESIRFGDALPVHERGSLARELRRVLARR
jgi:uncharacterized membrane protein